MREIPYEKVVERAGIREEDVERCAPLVPDEGVEFL